MNIPPYIKDESEDNYHIELNQALLGGVSDNGYTIPQVTTNQLTVDPFVLPDGTVVAGLAAGMPDGTIWYCTDHVPPVYVGLISGALVQFTTAAFP